MKRAHRRAHAVLWLLLIPLIAALLVIARRAPSPPHKPETVSEPAP